MGDNTNDEEDDLDLDFNFDDGDAFGDDGFSFEPKPIPDDRHPVTKAADSFKSKFGEKLLNEESIRSNLRKALPSEINETIDHVDDTLYTFRSAYDNTVKQIKPAIKEVKRSGRALKATFGNAIPEGISKWLDSVLHDDEDAMGRTHQSEEELRENEIAQTMATIFAHQTQKEGEERREDQVLNIASIKQSGEQLNVSAQMLRGMLRLVDYQDQIGSKWQQKMLEMTMRQYHVQSSLLRHFTEHAALFKENIPILVKNTALPDLVKQTNSELLKDVGMRKLMQDIQTSVFEKIGIGKQIKALGVHLQSVAQEKIVSPIIQIAEMVAQGLDGIGDMRNMANDMSFGEQTYIESDRDKETKRLSGAAGDLAAGSVHGFVARWLHEKIMNTERGKNIATQFGRWNRNASVMLNNYYRNGAELNNDNGDETFVGKTLNWLRDALSLDELAVGGVGSKQLSNTQMNLANLHDVAQYTNYTQKSITEIIPGYLARILQSTEGIRTGELSDLVVFDHRRNTFVGRNRMKADFLKEYDDLSSRLNDNTNRMSYALFGRDYQVGIDDQEKLKKYLVKLGQQGQLFDYDELVEKNLAELSPEAVAALKTQYDLTMKTDKEGKTLAESDQNKRRDELEAMMWSFGRYLPKELDLTRHLAISGVNTTDILRELGFIEKDGLESHRIQDKNIYDYFYRRAREMAVKPTDTRPDGNLNKTDTQDHAVPTTTLPPQQGVLHPQSGHQSLINHPAALLTGQISSGDIRQMSTTLAEIHHLLEGNLSQVTALYQTATQRIDEKAIVVDTDGIIGSINDQTVALLEALNRVNQNVIGIGKISDQGKGNFIPTDVRPDEITSNLINWNKLARYGREGLVKGKDAIVKAYDVIKNTAITTGSVLNKVVLKPVKDLLDKASQKLLTMDLYLPDNLEIPLIKARDFALGLYCDAEGRILRSLSDVKGNIYQVVNGARGPLVATYEELTNKLIDITGKHFDITKYTSVGKRILSGILTFSKEKLSFLNPMKMIDAAKEMARAAYLRTKELMMKDIYVGDETIPRITGVQLMTGAFYCNGKPLYRAKDIIADVFDVNGKIVLSLEEMRNKGLFDYKRRPYKDILDSALGGIGNVFGSVMGIGRVAWEKVKKVGKGIKDLGMGFLKGMFGKFDLSLEVNSKWTKRIYEILAWKFKGQPDHHKDDIKNDNPTESKTTTEQAKDYAEKAKDIWQNRERYAESTKKAFEGALDVLDRTTIGDKTAREKINELGETKAGQWVKDKAGRVSDAASKINQGIRDEEGKISLIHAKRSTANLYDRLADNAGKIRNDLSEYTPELLHKLKLENSDKYIEYLAQFKDGWVAWDALPKSLEESLRRYHQSNGKLVKPDGSGKLMVNLKGLLKAEAKRLRQEAEDATAEKKKTLQENMSDLLNIFRKKDKDSKKQEKKATDSSKKEKAETLREKMRRIKETALQKKESFFNGIIDRFTGKRRKGSWRDKGENTNKKRSWFGFGKDKDGDEKKGLTNWIKNTAMMVGVAFKSAIVGAGTFLLKVMSGIGMIMKGIGKTLAAPLKFGWGLLTGKGTSWSAKAGQMVRTGIGAVIKHGTPRLLALGATVAGWAIVLGGVAAVGWGAYKAWKFFRDEFKELDEYRLACYGVHAHNDPNKSNKLLAFEKAVDEVCTIDQKTGQLSFGKIDEKKWAAFFWDVGIDGELTEADLKNKQLPRFKDWYLYRFLPIYKKFREVLAAMELGDVAMVWHKIDGLYDMDSDMVVGYRPAFARMSFPKDDQVKPEGSPLKYFEYEGLPFSDHDTGALVHSQIKHYHDKVINTYSKEEARLKKMLQKQSADKLKGDKFTFESQYELGIMGDRAVGKEPKDWKIDEGTKKALEAGVAVSGSTKVKVKNQITGEEREITASEAAAMVGYKGGVVSDFQVLRVSAYGLLPVRPEPFTVENVRTVLALEAYLMKSGMFRMTDDRDWGWATLGMGDYPYKMEDAYDETMLDKLVDQFGVKFGYDLSSIPDKQDFKRVLVERVFPIVKRLMGWMKQVDKTFWTSSQSTAMGSMDKMENDKQLLLAELAFIDESYIKDITKKMERPGLFKKYPNMIDPDSAWATSIQNIKSKKKQTPAGLPEDENKRKEMADKLKAKIQKHLEQRKAMRDGDDKGFSATTTPGTTNNITGVADGNLHGTTYGSKSMPREAPIDIDFGKGAMGELGEVSLSGLKDVKSVQIPLDQVRQRYGGMKSPQLEKEMVPMIKEIAKLTGVPESLMIKMAAQESSFNPLVKSPTSTATGLYQFTDPTWDDMIKKYGQKIGIPSDPDRRWRIHPVVNAYMGAMFFRDNHKALTDAGVRNISEADMYGMHFMGRGYRFVRKATQDNPNMTVSELIATGITTSDKGKEWLAPAVKSNAGIFKQGLNTTLGSFYNTLHQKMTNKDKQALLARHGVTDNTSVDLVRAAEEVNLDADVHGATSVPVAPQGGAESVTDMGSYSQALKTQLDQSGNAILVDDPHGQLEQGGSAPNGMMTSGHQPSLGGLTDQDFRAGQRTPMAHASGAMSSQAMGQWLDTVPGKDLLKGRPSIPHELRGPLKSGQLQVKNGIKPQALPGYDGTQRYYDAPPGEISKNRVDLLDPNTKEALNMLAYDYSVNHANYQQGSSTPLPKRLMVTNSFRTEAEQFALKQAGYKANPPGGSAHEYGLAVDLDIPQAEALDKAGVLEKYGLYRPVPNDKREKQHVQAKLVVPANQSETTLSAPTGSGVLANTQSEVMETVSETPMVSTSMRPYGGEPSPMAPSPTGFTPVEPTFPISPTQQMQSMMDKQVVQQDAISLARTEELLSEQVQLQKESNQIVNEIVMLMKQRQAEKPPGATNTNPTASEKETMMLTAQEDASRRIQRGDVRQGPIKTSV